MSRPVEAVLIGAGYRGYYTFGMYALEHPNEIRYVAVAEPNEELRERFARAHNIPPERCFRSWEDLAVREQLAPLLFNATMDTTHFPSTMAALERGYDVLLEKPMAVTPVDCIRLVESANAFKRNLWVWHEMRYTEFFSTIHQLVQSGRLGDVITVEHRENVAFWHMAHAFVRGNWRNTKTSAPMILTKCCHDLDILFWILGKQAVRLSSFGSLLHFRPDRAPHPEVPERCTDGCPVEDECPFYAPRLYIGGPSEGLARHLSIDQSRSSIMEALRNGPYGRCVYRCSNDVVDHQVVNMEFEGETMVTLIMHGHSHEPSRTVRFDGTRATLQGRFAGVGPEITVHDHRTGQVERIVPKAGSGHGGGDEKLMETFVQAMRGEGPGLLNSASEALESHLMAFAAEESRVDGGVVIDMEEYRRKAYAQARAS